MSNHEYLNHNLKNKTNINNYVPIKTELKFGEYFLTPLESFLINKSMPHGFKLELMENLIKFSNPDSKDRKKNNRNKNNIQSQINLHNHNNKINNKKEKNELSKAKKRINHDLHLDNNFNDIKREKYKIAKKCKVAMEKLKEFSFANKFYEFEDIDIPSLSKVEKKINNYEYESFYDFEMDIRKIWSHFFYIGEKGDQEIYENTSKMSEKFENICSELENTNEDIYENISNSVLRRAEKNRKEILEIKQNEKDIINKNNINNFKNNNLNNKEFNTPMSKDEKNKLGILIQTSLNMDQLKGIAKIIMGKDNMRVLEFDLDQLPNDKLRNLEKYVNECVEINNTKTNKNGISLKTKNNYQNKENEEKNKKINNEENGMKKIDDKIEQNKENQINIEKGNEDNKNDEKAKIFENINNNKNNNSFSDSLSSDSSLSD